MEYNIDIHIGKRLRQRRLEMHITQEQLAEIGDVTFQQIQKYEKGINRISCSKLYYFARYLCTRFDYFFEGLKDHEHWQYKSTSSPATLAISDQKQSSYGKARALDDDAKTLLSYFQSANDTQKRKIINNVRRILEKKDA